MGAHGSLTTEKRLPDARRAICTWERTEKWFRAGRRLGIFPLACREPWREWRLHKNILANLLWPKIWRRRFGWRKMAFRLARNSREPCADRQTGWDNFPRARESS